MPDILIVDPLTLMGRELLTLLSHQGLTGHDIRYLHTADDGEHQIAELAGEPALVPPLQDEGDLSGCGVVLVASESDTDRGAHLVRFVESQPTLPVIVLGFRTRLYDLTVPSAGPSYPLHSPQVHVAHPALVVLCTTIDCLSHLEPRWATVTAIEPVSTGGSDAVERLARQASQRLMGAEVYERIGGEVLAFTAVEADSDALHRDAALLLPDLSVAVTRTISGHFHGHVAHLGLGFDQSVDEHSLLEALRDDERFADPDLPIRLDAAIDRDVILSSLPSVSNDGRTVALTCMADGLRVGGAQTALQILRTLI